MTNQTIPRRSAAFASILQEFLGRGYFPKELPPAFSTLSFGAWATTADGKKVVANYCLPDRMSECVRYRLALPGSAGLAERVLAIPHPHSFATHCGLVTKRLGTLLRRSGATEFSRSRPIFEPGHLRPVRPAYTPSNLLQERMKVRAGARFLLKLDVSHFYPSLYTHAVGWAVSPELRLRANWRNPSIFGKQLDQSLMDMQGKISQGIPIGPDTSFLLAEVVLASVDKAAKLPKASTFRWYDDYEVACATRNEAEAALQSLRAALATFKLRPNLLKTAIVPLPAASSDGWQTALALLSKGVGQRSSSMAKYFDRAFQLAERNPGSPVLMYAMGCLFETPLPEPFAFTVALGAITQALLAEPGCAQKAFALLTYWGLNGATLDVTLLAETIGRLCKQHSARGASSDVAWALAFALQHDIPLRKSVGAELMDSEDDVVLLEVLHAHSKGLLPGVNASKLDKWLSQEACNGEHWLALYESVRHGWAPKAAAQVKADTFMRTMLSADVAFYNTSLAPYAMVLSHGGAPTWIVERWLRKARRRSPKATGTMTGIERLISHDLRGRSLDRSGTKEQLKRLRKTRESRGRHTSSQY